MLILLIFRYFSRKEFFNGELLSQVEWKQIFMTYPLGPYPSKREMSEVVNLVPCLGYFPFMLPNILMEPYMM